tara:strand:- start:1762 stop:4266 length:2505 start_codon:yes stop_codon:yes gene_type:complete
MDIIIYIIFILLIIGIVLLSKKYIKNKIEGFSELAEIQNKISTGDDSDLEYSELTSNNVASKVNLEPEYDEDGYEIVSARPPPDHGDAIYDFNLKNAKEVWKDIGCRMERNVVEDGKIKKDASGKPVEEPNPYAPNRKNKTDIFGEVGWSSEEYKFRVKSMHVEANKSEYNSYDWGMYDGTDVAIKEEHAAGNANNWKLDGSNDKMTAGWKTVINRPASVKYPMGIRKAKALCYGIDDGEYELPKKGDRVKIKKGKEYDSPYFSGIVMSGAAGSGDAGSGTAISGKVDPNGAVEIRVGAPVADTMQVRWDKKGTSSMGNGKIINKLNNAPCGTLDLNSGDTNCTRDQTKGEPAEIKLDKANLDSIGVKLYGTGEAAGIDGQQDWFGWDGTGNKKIPEKLKSYNQSIPTICEDGSVDPESVFIVKKCIPNSKCEDLRCDTIVKKSQTMYPYTNICVENKKNDVRNTNGQFCTTNGSVFTYHTESDICDFQRMGGKRYPGNYCESNCTGSCLDVTEAIGGKVFIRVFSSDDEVNREGSIVRLGDAPVNIKFAGKSKNITKIKGLQKGYAAILHHGNAVRVIDKDGVIKINPCPSALPHQLLYSGTNWYCYKDSSKEGGVCSYSGQLPTPRPGIWNQNQGRCANAMDEIKRIELRKIYTHNSDDSQINPGYRPTLLPFGNKIVHVPDGTNRKEYIARIPMRGKNVKIIKINSLSAIDQRWDDNDTKIVFKFRHTDNTMSTLGELTLNRIKEDFLSTQNGEYLEFYTTKPGFTTDLIPLNKGGYDYFKNWVINYNYNQTFKNMSVNKDKPVKYLELYPSRYNNGHSLIYLGFKNLKVL